MTSSSGARSVSAASTPSNRRWRAPASPAAPGAARRRRRPARSASANGSKAASGSSEQRPSRTVAPSASAARGELVGEPGLADAGLAREQHEAPVAVHLHARPRRAQALELGAAADELGAVRARERARAPRPARPGRAAARRAARASRATARCRARRAAARRSARRRPARRRGRRRARAARSGAGSAPRRAGRARPARASGGSPSAGSAARPRAARAPRRAAARAPGARRGPTRPRSRRGSARGTPPAHAAGSPASSAASNARVSTVSPAPSSATVSRVATRWPAAGPSARRSSVSAARRLVRADSSSTSGQKRAASWARACGARVQREVGEQRARAARGGRRELGAAGAQRQPSARVGPPARANCRPCGTRTQDERATFTHAERCASGRSRRSPPCRSHAAATCACSPVPPVSPRSATSWPSSR